jgi:hypothetical protein
MIQHQVLYIESPSIPPGMTVAEYRRSRPRQPSRWARLKRLARPATA